MSGLATIIRAIADLDVYLERKIKEVRNLENQLKNASQFNHRQLALLSHATHHLGTEYSIKSHQQRNNVAYATARVDLLDLAKKGLLEMYRSGKKQIFIAPDDLTERLKTAV